MIDENGNVVSPILMGDPVKKFYDYTEIRYDTGVWKFTCCNSILPWGDPIHKPSNKIECPYCLDVNMVLNRTERNVPLRLNGEILTPMEYNVLTPDKIHEIVPSPNRNIMITTVAHISKKQINRALTLDDVTDEEILAYIEKISVGHIKRYANKRWSLENRENTISQINQFVADLSMGKLETTLSPDMINILYSDGRLIEFMNATSIASLNQSIKTKKALSYLVGRIKTDKYSDVVDSTLLSLLS